MKEYQQVAVSGFILSNTGKVLVVKRSDEDDFLPGLWELPGGGTDFGEEPQEALVREMKEEVGLDVEVGKSLKVMAYFMEKDDEKIQRVEIFFECKMKDLDREVTLSFEHSEYKWITKDDIPSLGMTEYMTEAIEGCYE